MPQRDSSSFNLTKVTEDGRELESRTVVGAAKAQQMHESLNRELTATEKAQGTRWLLQAKSGVGRDRLLGGFKPRAPSLGAKRKR